jgi:phosphoglycerate-specific signal transduction histidine kinase
MMRRLTRRATRVALNAVHLRQVMTAAMPLIQTLGEDQKRDALALARTMGLGSLSLAY